MKKSFLLLFSIGIASTSFVTQPPWPNLDILKDYPKVGQTCSIDGNPLAEPQKKAQNRLKNRYKLPNAIVADVITVQNLIDLPSGTKTNPPAINDPNHSRFVSMEGYIDKIDYGGTKGESCNCKATNKGMVDIHIDIVAEKSSLGMNDERKSVVAEVTFRTQILVQNGLLSSNIGNEWTRRNLRDRLLGRRVKLSGWLFYDYDHHDESWSLDPSDNYKRNNWRATAWEIHPVMGIEVLP